MNNKKLNYMLLCQLIWEKKVITPQRQFSDVKRHMRNLWQFEYFRAKSYCCAVKLLKFNEKKLKKWKW